MKWKQTKNVVSYSQQDRNRPNRYTNASHKMSKYILIDENQLDLFVDKN